MTPLTLRPWGRIFLLACVLPGCQTRELEPTLAQASAGLGSTIFEDAFERQELGSAWMRGKGEGGEGMWRIQDGALIASQIKNDALWWTGRLPERVRVEFDATALSDQGDLKFEIFGDGKAHESGYIGILGGWNNSLDVIARLDEHGGDRLAAPSIKAVKGRTYRFAIERTDADVLWSVDGKELLRYKDPSPLKGEGHRSFGFNNWEAPVKFDNFTVIRL